MSHSMPVETFNRKEQINYYIEISQKYINLHKELQNQYTDENDARHLSIGLMNEALQSHLLMLDLINTSWQNISIINETQRNDEKFMKDRLYFLDNHNRFSLFINVFVEFEHFLRMLGLSVSPIINYISINKLTNDLLDRLMPTHPNIAEYKNLCNIIFYTRNTMHFGGIHTRDPVTIKYKNIDFKFTQNQPLTCYNNDNEKLILMDLAFLLEEIIKYTNHIPSIKHSYTDITFVYQS